MTSFLLFLFQIEKVFDQFVHFISLEHSMFTLRHQTNYSAPNNLSFYSLNKSDVTDTEMENIINDIVDGLFAICVTLGKTYTFIFTKFILMKNKINQCYSFALYLGTVPVIRCPKGNAAEFVAKKLDKKLRENLRDTRNSLFLNDGGGMQGGGSGHFR